MNVGDGGVEEIDDGRAAGERDGSGVVCREAKRVLESIDRRGSSVGIGTEDVRCVSSTG